MPHKLRRSQLIEFEDVAAGHEGMRSDKSGAIVVKPCRQAEIEFYESAVQHSRFREYIPDFVGTVVLNQEASAAVGAQVPGPVHGHTRSQSLMLEPSHATSTSDAWVPSGGGSIAAEKGIALENVAFGFSKPNILDVKLGARLWADDAPQPKRQKLDRVASETTSGSQNFRIAGMKTWMGPNASLLYRNNNGYRKYDKNYGRSLKDDNVIDGFRQYFLPDGAGIKDALAKRVIRRFRADLKDLITVLSEEESRMYSASLLFVYEGDAKQLEEKFQVDALIRQEQKRSSQAQIKDRTRQGSTEFIEVDAERPSDAVDTPEILIVEATSGNETAESDSDSEAGSPKIQALKMIDFAHATWTPGQGPDENVIRGITKTIQVLDELIKDIETNG